VVEIRFGKWVWRFFMAGAAEAKLAWVEYHSRGAMIRAYLGLPGGAGPWPGIVMVHENPGMTDHRLDVARRLAEAGYATITAGIRRQVLATSSAAKRSTWRCPTIRCLAI
jgi:hypothetical protein